MTTDYQGRPVDTVVRYLDEEANLLCLNDDCAGIEVQRDEDDGTVVEVIRVAWDGQYVGASGPTYSCGGEPGYYRRDWCPQCGQAEAVAL